VILASGLTHTVNDGPLLVAAGVALLVGVVGFLSPCVLPLVPGYLSYVAGLSGTDERPSQKRMLAGAALFVLGFSFIFVAQGALFGELGGDIRAHTRALEQVLGGVTIVMGLIFLGFVRFAQREFRIHKLPVAGLLGAPLLGAAFGLAWAPCLTPTFSAVYSLSFQQGTLGRGAFLTACYCLGLGIPFLIVALGFGWATSALTFIRRHMVVVSRIGGALLIVIGILLVTGQWDHWMNDLRANFGTSAGISV
jgi:cytochrome c-type biogenesis protein